MKKYVVEFNSQSMLTASKQVLLRSCLVLSSSDELFQVPFVAQSDTAGRKLIQVCLAGNILGCEVGLVNGDFV